MRSLEQLDCVPRASHFGIAPLNDNLARVGYEGRRSGVVPHGRLAGLGRMSDRGAVLASPAPRGAGSGEPGRVHGGRRGGHSEQLKRVMWRPRCRVTHSFVHTPSERGMESLSRRLQDAGNFIEREAKVLEEKVQKGEFKNLTGGVTVSRSYEVRISSMAFSRGLVSHLGRLQQQRRSVPERRCLCIGGHLHYRCWHCAASSRDGSRLSAAL